MELMFAPCKKLIRIPRVWATQIRFTIYRPCHPPAHQKVSKRAEEKQRVASAAGIETADIASDARKEEAHFEEPAFLEVRRCDEGGPPILATAVLRLQSVE